jgi:hypothetical protein
MRDSIFLAVFFLEKMYFIPNFGQILTYITKNVEYLCIIEIFVLINSCFKGFMAQHFACLKRIILLNRSVGTFT